jgi:MFS family permease
MSSIGGATPAAGGTGILAKERTIVGAGYNRWLVPPAALAIHLCIGMAYGFSVFWLPLSQAVGINHAVACAPTVGFWDALFVSDCDWKVKQLGWMYTLFFVFLGSAAALWGGWLEREGPRKAAVVATLCWCGGLVIGAYGVYLHQLWLMWLGAGALGGIGLGLGYISPVSTLIKWFPDRRGMATGMAIMGFGGGALVGSPLADRLMKHFATPTDVGVWQTFLAMAAIYFVFMMVGAFSYRLPALGWKPAGWTPPAEAQQKAMVTRGQVHLDKAWRTPQFWLIWGVLCLNVSASIGIIGLASPMLQEIFGGKLIGLDQGFSELGAPQKAQIATIGAAFAGLLSLFNIGGRFFWASISDYLGRKRTYIVFLLLGTALYLAAPGLGAARNTALFVLALGVIVSMYGGGFATVPAYLSDMFGTQMVGAIHGRLLTAWSTAGIVGPLLVNYLRDYRLEQGVPRGEVYGPILYLMAGLLVLGLVCNLMVKPVAPKYFMTEQELEAERKLAHERALSSAGGAASLAVSNPALVVAAWLFVGIPLAWGVWVTLQKAAALFN